MRYSAYLVCTSLVLALAACGGGNGDPPVMEMPAIEDLREVAGQATILRVSARHRVYLGRDGAMPDAPLADWSSIREYQCERTECTGHDETYILADATLNREYIEVTRFEAEAGDDFTTFSMTGRYIPGEEYAPGAIVISSDNLSTWGLWGEHGAAVIHTVGGPIEGIQDGFHYYIEGNSAYGFAFGSASGSNPTGMGSATWRGAAHGIRLGVWEHIEGTATLAIPDLSVPALNAVIELEGGSVIGDSDSWTDMTLTDGTFLVGVPAVNRITGAFMGPDHEEVYGAFDTDTYVGVFGATADE